jgi:hypothetical protein
MGGPSAEASHAPPTQYFGGGYCRALPPHAGAATASTARSARYTPIGLETQRQVSLEVGIVARGLLYHGHGRVGFRPRSYAEEPDER